MVARINTGKNISKSLNYNEQKVTLGKAELISASNFLKDMDKLSFRDKIWQFKRLTSLNERATTNSMHVSLNFDPTEKLGKEKLIEIADSYMNQIGFGVQPYLVYRHDDAGHPHIHIVSTNIQFTGNRISMHNLGRNQSEKARKIIEREFGLVRAEDKKNSKASELIPVNAYKAIYGRTETRQAISNVLNVVVNQFRYTSLPELNAILRLYNVAADPGAVGSRINNHRGLTYRILDERGNKVGVPIKASSFFMKPTLKLLESKYAENETLRQPFRRRLAVEIEYSLVKNPRAILDFSENLSRAGINVVLRQNTEGLVYGITYIDMKTRSVFNGSDLGKEYSAKGIFDRLGYDGKAGVNPVLKPLVSGQLYGYNEETKIGSKTDLIDILLRPEFVDGNLSQYPFKKDTKRKKKRGMSI